nr:GH25 family lysozyme [Sporolactobacillus spathodeae]
MFTGYVTSNSLQVYGGPGTQYSKIITLHKSNSVTVSGKSGSWYKVKSGSREGYVSSVNISKKKPILTSVSLQMDLKPRSGSNFNHYQAYVIANALNVRTSPTSSANNVITSLKKNTVVTVIGETGNWLQISYNGGRVGFVSASYVIKGTAPKVAGDPKKPYTPPNSTISQLGIDVSHWNNNPQNRNNQNYTGSDINYQALKAAGIRFVIVKATEGQSYYDKTFAENVNKANAAGLATYAYHFFHAKSVTDAAKEADYFLKTINGRISKNSYVFLDVEDSVGDPLTKDKAQLTSYVNQFFKVLDSNGYHRFGIYTGYDFYYSRLIASELPNTTRLWIARYRGSATYNGLGMPADIWQYTDQGKLQGINANVDIDISYFTDAAGI